MTSGPQFDYIGLALDMAGCPNACRHCFDFDPGDAKQGNLKEDGLAAILAKAASWEPPSYPRATVLAERYGDANSTLVHRRGASVQLQWIARYRAENRASAAF